MPVLIILLFYIHDLSKLKRYYDQTEFAAQQMVNILQNIAYTRLQEGKTISIQDIRYAFGLAWLNVYPGITMFKKKSGHELVHCPRAYIYYVKSEPEGKASCIWGFWLNTFNYSSGQWSCSYLTAPAYGSAHSSVNWGTNADPSSIYPTLRFSGEKAKIVLVFHLRWGSDSLDPEGKNANSAREVFKLFAINPKSHGTSNTSYFQSVVTFTPNKGFSEIAPK